MMASWMVLGSKIDSSIKKTKVQKRLDQAEDMYEDDKQMDEAGFDLEAVQGELTSSCKR
jgi:hypothetical protein